MAGVKGRDGIYSCGPGWGMGAAITASVLCAISACLTSTTLGGGL
jgi:hypothetical protein